MSASEPAARTRWPTLTTLLFSLLVTSLNAQPAPPSFSVQRELHLPSDDGQQGIATDGKFLYIQNTQQLFKYSLTGKLIQSGPKLALHHGGATVVDGRVYVAVSACASGGTSQHFVHAYDTQSLALVDAYDVGEHFSVCAGGIAHRNGSFFVAESFFDNDHDDRIVEFDAKLKHVRTHEVSFKSPYGVQGLEYLPETDQFQVHSHGREFYRINARFEEESLVAGKAGFDLQDIARIDEQTLLVNRRDAAKVLFIRAQLTGEEPPPVICEGTDGGHLQGIATDGKAIYWSHTVQLVKTDLAGVVSHRIEVPSHHGDLTYHNDRVYVAVELGKFNRPPGESKPWVYVYVAEDLTLQAIHRLPELVHGCGGIAYHSGRFIVVGGLPADHQQNYTFEYDETFRLKRRHVLPSGQTHLGIQTAGYVDGQWWFGCYGSPGNPGLLKANTDFQLVGQEVTDFSYGVAQFGKDRVLRGACFQGNRRGKLLVTSIDARTTSP